MTTATEQTSALARRRLHTELRSARDAAGLTQEQVISEMEWSISKLTRIENGTVGISKNDLRALLRLYGIDQPKRVNELMELAQASRAAKRKLPWLPKYRDLLSASYLKYIEFEASASVVRDFHPLLIPGLLQTADYARAIVSRGGPLQLGDDEIRRRVELRTQRQREFFSRRRTMTVLLGEAAVRQVVGGPTVMRNQLSALLDDERPWPTVRVVPFSAGAHPGLSGGFAILEFDGPIDDVLYLENAPDDVIEREGSGLASNYRRSFGELEKASLSIADTAALIRDVIKELS